MLDLAVPSFTQSQYPRQQARSTAYTVWVEGQRVEALHARGADFVQLEIPPGSRRLEVLVQATGDTDGASLRPLRAGVRLDARDQELRFTLPGPGYYCLDLPELKPLFFYVEAPETNVPDRHDPNLRYYAAGAVHEIGELRLKAGETLYIEGGAVVRGSIIASSTDNVSIRGRGILDGSCYSFEEGDRVRSIIVEYSRNVLVEGITMIEPTSWMLVLGCCDGVQVRGIKQIGAVISTDGIDICASRNVLIENCCLRNDDDNIAIKAVSIPRHRPWVGDVEHVRVRDCLFLNGLPGNSMEIGYETRADSIRDVRFSNIDVIFKHGEGAVFSIHNGDRAVVDDIVWEDIHVDHYWDKLIDIRVVESRYNEDTQRGFVRNVTLRNIHVTKSIYNQGCSISIIGGYNADHRVENVTLKDLYLSGEKVTSPDQLDLFTRHAVGVRVV